MERVIEQHDGSVRYYVGDDFEVRDGISVVYARVQGARVARLVSTALQAELLADMAPEIKPDGRIDAGDAWLAHREGTDPARHLRGAARRLLLDAAPDTVFLHADHQGSLTLATGPDGDVLGERAFYPSGAARGQHGFVDAYGFTGQRQDETTGLVHHKHRELDPASARWASPDPLFAAATPEALGLWGEATTAYAYVANRFGDGADPTGLVRKGSEAGRASTGSSSGRSRGGSHASHESGGSAGGSRGSRTGSTESRYAPEVLEAAQQAYGDVRVLHGATEAAASNITATGMSVRRKGEGATATVASQVGAGFLNRAREHNFLTTDRAEAARYANTAARGTGLGRIVRFLVPRFIRRHFERDPDAGTDTAFRTRASLTAGTVLHGGEAGTMGIDAFRAALVTRLRDAGVADFNVTPEVAADLLREVASNSESDQALMDNEGAMGV
jgi:RHS repeat-associated protein